MALVAGILFGSAAPAHANAAITATSLDKSGAGRETTCSDASLAIGMDATTASVNTGTTTNLGGELHTFSQPSTFSGFSGVFPDYGMPVGSPQPLGTIIGSYATVGSATPTASDTAEWFLLYQCGDTTADSVVLFSCFGDYGTCPKTATEGVATLFHGAVDDTTPDPGQTITATGSGCFYPLGGALLMNGSTSLGGDSIATNPDGTYSISLTVPPGTAPGTALTVHFDCGNDGQSILSDTVDLTVAAPATTTTTVGTTTSTASRAVVVQPKFTG